MSHRDDSGPVALNRRPPAGVTPRPLGPRSMLWRFAGDHRLGLTGLSAGILQLMHPAIGAGVVQHSNFFDDPWDRIIRSMPQILGVVYDPEGEAVGRRVREIHRAIKGVDDSGRRYSALSPTTFWWAHATFQHSVEQVVDRFDRKTLNEEEREELYQDGVEWYRRYGVSMRPVPANREEFGTKWRRYCDEVLEMTPAAERAVEMALNDRSLGVPFLPWWTKPLQPLVVTPVLQLTAIGGLPRRIRRRFGIPWRIDQEMQYRSLQLAVRESWRFVPENLRYGPIAAAGRKAAREAAAVQAAVA